MLDILPANPATCFGDATLRDSEAQCEANAGFWRLAYLTHYFFGHGLHGSAAAVYSLGDKFNVPRINAWMNFTKMIQHKPIWWTAFGQRTISLFIVKAVRCLANSITLYEPISTDTGSELPNPARRLIASVLHYVIDRGKTAGMTLQKTHGFSPNASRLAISFIGYFGRCAAAAMAAAVWNIHLTPSSGKVAAGAGRLQPLEGF